MFPGVTVKAGELQGLHLTQGFHKLPFHLLFALHQLPIDGLLPCGSSIPGLQLILLPHLINQLNV